MTSVWSRFFGRRPSIISGFETLPEEILIDHIISRLSVREILMLRRTNKAICLVTKTKTIWKRFLPYLHSMQQPLASLPPTWKFNAQEISSLELERLVTRAISLDNNWRGETPKIYKELHCTMYDKVLDMALLPGGHYLVASMHNLSGQHSIVIWTTDHPATGRPAPIIFRRTMYRAYHLQAKYMTVNGKKSICIAFLRKRHKDSSDKRPIHITVEMGSKPDEEDAQMPIKYDCTTISIPLDSLALLTDRRFPPGSKTFKHMVYTTGKQDPVEVASRIRTGCQLTAVSLTEMFGEPYICVLKRPNRIILENLNSKKRVTLTCRPPDQYQEERYIDSIWNFRLIPNQFQIIVFCVIRPRMVASRRNTNIVELFNIPDLSGDHILSPTSTRHIQSFDYLMNVQFAEMRTGCTAEDESIMPSIAADKPPPPVSFYLRYNTHIDHLTIWPVARPFLSFRPPLPGSAGKERSKIEYTYYLEGLEIQKFETENEHGMELLRTVPGAYRALVYTVPPGHISLPTPVIGLSTYVYRGTEAIYLDEEAAIQVVPDYRVKYPKGMTVNDWAVKEDENMVVEEEEHRKLVWPQQRQKINEERQILASVALQDAFAKVLREGISAIAWDEDTGRVCISTNSDRQLHILDFSCARKPDQDDNLLCDEMEKIELEETNRMQLFSTPAEIP